MTPRVRLLPPRALGHSATANYAQAREGADAFMKSLGRYSVVRKEVDKRPMTSLKERAAYWTVAIALVVLVNKALDFVDWIKRKRQESRHKSLK